MFQNDLVAQCRANDRKAQLTLYKQYCEGMFCLAMRFLKSPDDAEDVVQEAFIKAFQKLHQFRGEVTFGAWLKRIVINKCIDHLSKNKYHHEEFTENTLRIAEDTNWTVDNSVKISEVRSAMNALPEKYKYVVQLYLVEGYDHQEISKILNLTETASRTRLLRGKNHLKELLRKKHHGTGS